MEKLSLRYKNEYIDLSNSLSNLTFGGNLKNHEFLNHIVDNTIEIDDLEQEKKEKVLFELLSLEFSTLVSILGQEYLRKDLSPTELAEKERYDFMVMQFEGLQFKMKKGFEIKNKEIVLERLLKEMNDIYHSKMNEELNNHYIR